MIYVEKTLNHKIYEINPSYSQYSKNVKACATSFRETIVLQVENAILQKLWK